MLGILWVVFFGIVNIEMISIQGEKLILTPFIKKGDIQGGQEAATVPPLLGSLKSYSGYLTVNERYNSNLFFWYFPCEKSSESPVVLWLNGGPGGSSLIGLFLENGPYQLHENGNLTLRDYRWTKFANIIYIDQPVGTGFSFTNNTSGYAVNVTMAADDMYIAISQFFLLFPNLRKNEFFLIGESYAGKFIPAIAYKIFQMEHVSKNNINLKGLALGNPYLDPITIVPTYGKQLHQIGLIDSKTMKEYEHIQNAIVNYIKTSDFVIAEKLFDSFILDDFFKYSSFYTNSTGFKNYQNYLFPPDLLGNYNITTFFRNDSLRKDIHVGYESFEFINYEVEKYFIATQMRSIKPWFDVLLDKYRIVIFHGQLDVTIPYTAILALMRSARWSGADEYKNAERKVWRIGDYLAGYTKSARNFTEILVRNSGHLVAYDQPLSAYTLIHKFVNNLIF